MAVFNLREVIAFLLWLVSNFFLPTSTFETMSFARQTLRRKATDFMNVCRKFLNPYMIWLMAVVEIIPLKRFRHCARNKSLVLGLFCIRKQVSVCLSNIIVINSWLHNTSNNNLICKEIFMFVPYIKWRLKHFIIQQMHKYIISRHN